MFNNVIKLVKEVKSVDGYGDTTTTQHEKVIFAELKSIGQSEFYQAQAVGLRPEIKFIIADWLDYNDEKIVRYKAFNDAEEQEYTVLRTYRDGNTLEIICKRGIDE